MPEQPRSFYSRLFPGKWDGYPNKLMSLLADWLEDTPPHRGNRPRQIPGAIPSGYVYLAQIVNHDLSHDYTKLSEVGDSPPEITSNWRTPCLDLELLYGEGPELDPVLYDSNHPRGDGYLALGHTEAAPGKQSDNDIIRDRAGKALVFDSRTDSTVLLAHLQVLLTKFHNRLLDDLRAGKISGTVGGDDFEEAKRLTTWHYQWIVRNDLLPKIVMPDVLNDITMHWPRLFRPRLGEASIPVEFTLAAFEYGHSAVQVFYNINRKVGLCSQEDTMYMTGPAQFVRPNKNDPPCRRLPENFVVDPGRMFGWAPPARSNFSAGIDTLMAGGLYKVPGDLSRILLSESLTETGLTFRSEEEGGPKTFKLPEVTLRRAAAAGLPSGQVACELAGVDSLGRDQLAYDSSMEHFLDKSGMLDRTPLFYYLMREAEISGRMVPCGLPRKRLGPLGSRIVAEVILGVLSADPDSYVQSDWQPPVISGDFAGSEMRINNLRKLALYAKDYSSPSR